MPTTRWFRVPALGAYLLGISGAGIFFAYVLGTGTGFLPRPEGPGELAWLIDLGWLLLLAVQHSGMARASFKRWWTRWIPAPLERSVYVTVSGLLLAALTLCWQPLPGEPLWQGPTWIAAVSVLGALGAGACCLAFDHTAFFGLRQAWTGSAEFETPLRVNGPYRFVRHPLMLGLLIALWAQPTLPPELFLMNTGLTLYIFVGIRLEERDLVRQFGAQYLAYRARTSALLPLVNKFSQMY